MFSVDSYAAHALYFIPGPLAQISDLLDGSNPYAELRLRSNIINVCALANRASTGNRHNRGIWGFHDGLAYDPRISYFIKEG